jgi:hypothetical protein
MSSLSLNPPETMRVIPILFSALMVRAILDGIKTLTRRTQGLETVNINPDARVGAINTHENMWDFLMHDGGIQRGVKCPYGKPGDHLWVREAFWAFGKWEQRYSEKKQRKEWCFIDMTLERDRLYQYQDPSPGKFRHRRDIDPAWWPRNSIHMPRKASRIQLEITGVRVERLQDISEADAVAEGIQLFSDGTFKNYLLEDHFDQPGLLPIESYKSLWETINGPSSWDANPWVWVVEFKVIKP